MTMDWIEPFLAEHEDLRKHVDLVAVPPDWDEACKKHRKLNHQMDLKHRAYEFVAHDGQGHGLTRLALYMISRRKGNTHAMAATFAMQKMPGIETTDTFWAGRTPFHQVYGEQFANDMRSKLARQGVRLGEGGEYMPELARFPGDPEAVIPFDGARDRIRKICEQRGWSCNGAVNVDGREPDSDPHDLSGRPGLAEDIIRKNARRMISEDPAMARKSKQEIREAVIAKHGPTK